MKYESCKLKKQKLTTVYGYYIVKFMLNLLTYQHQFMVPSARLNRSPIRRRRAMAEIQKAPFDRELHFWKKVIIQI